MTRVAQNSREFTRVPIRLNVEIQSGESVLTSSQSEDLSMKGIFVKCDSSLSEGTRCSVILCLEGEKDVIKAGLSGIVRRTNAEGMAIEFTEMTLDSYQHLQNLVRFNTHDVEEVENEFKDHLGIKKKE